jgi:hypothetical protein
MSATPLLVVAVDGMSCTNMASCCLSSFVILYNGSATQKMRTETVTGSCGKLAPLLHTLGSVKGAAARVRPVT